MAKQLSTTTTPLCLGFFRCRVDVLQSLFCGIQCVYSSVLCINLADHVFLQVLLSAACSFAVLLQFMSNLMYRDDHTTDCWINLLRLPIITIVTSSLYNYIISLCNKACNKGLRIEKLAKCRYTIPMLRFRYFQVLLLPGFYSIVFSCCFYFSQRPKHQHLVFSVAVRSSLTLTLSRVQ